MTKTLQEKAQHIRCLISDVDGVFTDGTLSYTSDGHATSHFNVQDGLGIKLLLGTGIQCAIITGRQSTLVAKRMTDLGIENVHQGCIEKTPAYEMIKQSYDLEDHEIAYVGDDLPDLPLIRRVGLGIAVANAVDFVKSHADWVTTNTGGRGAIREVCEFLLNAQNRLTHIHEKYAAE